MKITFLSLLALIFITLKLCSVIAWPWLWVTSPLWIPLAIIAVLFVIAVVMGLIGHALEASARRKREKEREAYLAELDAKREAERASRQVAFRRTVAPL
jgi:citrate synthase